MDASFAQSGAVFDALSSVTSAGLATSLLQAEVLSMAEMERTCAALTPHLNLSLHNNIFDLREEDFLPSVQHARRMEVAAKLLTLSNSPLATRDWLARPLWKSGERFAEQTKILNGILSKAEALHKKGKTPVLVMDVDDTIYANGFRKAIILREYGLEHGLPLLQQTEPEQAEHWDMGKVLAENLSLDTALVATHLDPLTTFWEERFYTSAYILFDQPLPGAASFACAFYALGGAIFYVTGRNEQNMRAGTVAIMRRDGFPIDIEGTTLLCKPSLPLVGAESTLSQAERNEANKEADATFKERVFKLPRRVGSVVAYLDNEPANILRWLEERDAAKRGMAVWLDTSTGPNPATLPGDIPTLHGFLR
ncbi:MAG: hypothetical protein Q7T03_08800 [Deltaproteobacteria bacterium]|nr:hypothetical protein [Deltaproteobacteria bacterium]